MTPSATLCRTQEALHRRLAAETNLDNIRAVATRAAIAWGKEADAATIREERQSRTRLATAAGDGASDHDRASEQAA